MRHTLSQIGNNNQRSYQGSPPNSQKQESEVPVSTVCIQCICINMSLLSEVTYNCNNAPASHNVWLAINSSFLALVPFPRLFLVQLWGGRKGNEEYIKVRSPGLITQSRVLTLNHLHESPSHSKSLVELMHHPEFSL